MHTNPNSTFAVYYSHLFLMSVGGDTDTCSTIICKMDIIYMHAIIMSNYVWYL